MYPAFQVTAHLAPRSGPGQPDIYASKIDPGPSQTKGQQQQQGVKKTVEEGEAGAKGIEGHDGQQN